jgi:transposase-like protein
MNTRQSFTKEFKLEAVQLIDLVKSQPPRLPGSRVASRVDAQPV